MLDKSSIYRSSFPSKPQKEASEAKRNPDESFDSKEMGDDMENVSDEDEINESTMLLVSATANIILPFEMMKKALSLDYGTETSSPEGMYG